MCFTLAETRKLLLYFVETSKNGDRNAVCDTSNPVEDFPQALYQIYDWVKLKKHAGLLDKRHFNSPSCPHLSGVAVDVLGPGLVPVSQQLDGRRVCAESQQVGSFFVQDTVVVQQAVVQQGSEEESGKVEEVWNETGEIF